MKKKCVKTDIFIEFKGYQESQNKIFVKNLLWKAVLITIDTSELNTKNQ